MYPRSGTWREYSEILDNLFLVVEADPVYLRVLQLTIACCFAASLTCSGKYFLHFKLELSISSLVVNDLHRNHAFDSNNHKFKRLLRMRGLTFHINPVSALRIDYTRPQLIKIKTIYTRLVSKELFSLKNTYALCP